MALFSSFFVAYLYVRLVEGYVGVGLNDPATCWIKNDSSLYIDDFADCWLMVLIPYMMVNLRSLTNLGEGLVQEVLRPYIHRMMVFIGIACFQIMFEVWCHLVQLMITDFRNSRFARIISILLSA
jgi:hypothetical protein